MSSDFRRILGVNFYVGDLKGLVGLTEKGGLFVVPAAPALVDLPTDQYYREALEESDIAITDSGFMVLIWAIRKGEILARVSGLKFLSGLLNSTGFRQTKATFWVMPSVEEREANIAYLRTVGMDVEENDTHIAPFYSSGTIQDRELLKKLENRRPKFVVINLGGGVQEKLGLYLRNNLTYKPAIICTGAAIAFLSGQQANIPTWADRLFLGWLSRCVSSPKKFVPRYLKGLRLVPLLFSFAEKSTASPSVIEARSR